MHSTLAVVVFCACMTITVQHSIGEHANGDPGPPPPAPPNKEDNPNKPRINQGTVRKMNDFMQNVAGSMEKMGIHMKFEFDIGAAALAGMAGQGRDMGQKNSGKEPNMESQGMRRGSDVSVKSDEMGAKGYDKDDKDTTMGGRSGKGDSRPHIPILCRVNASGVIVTRECPYNLTCASGMGIKQGNWTMYFCRKDPAMRDVTEFDYPDEGELGKVSMDDGENENDDAIYDGDTLGDKDADDDDEDDMPN